MFSSRLFWLAFVIVFAVHGIHALNIMRQQEVISDTKKLLKLTTKLNDEIQGSHAKSLTHHQLRMLGKIEKLAKNIREEMSSPIE